MSSVSESLGRLVSCLNAAEPQPYLVFQPRELTAACKALRCSSDWLLGLTDDDTRISKNARDRDVAAAFEKGLAAEKTEHDKRWALARDRADRAESELNAFVGDIEALIPEDCRNTRPDRLASVRAAVGMMAQRCKPIDNSPLFASIAKIADGIRHIPLTVAPDGRVVDKPEAAPGTGAWAWEQMQRGSDIWVRRQDWPMSDRVHLVEPGLIVDQEGARAGKKLGAVGSPMWPEWLAIDDWELCAAPGSKEAKQAEFYALADSVSDTPFTAPSAKDGPTEVQVKQWRAAMWGKQVNATPSDWEELSSELRRTFCGFAELCWQAAREGMVPQADIGTRERALIIDRDAIRAELTTTQDELRACKSVHKLWRELADQHTGRSADDHQRRAVSDMLDQRTAWESWCADMVYRNPESHRIPDEHQGRQMLTARLDDYYELNLMFPDRGEGEGPVPPIYAVAESLIGRLRSDLKHERAELERVKAELATVEAESARRLSALLTPASAWTTQITTEQVGAAWDALSEGENYVATKWEALKPGHREHYVKVVNAVLQVPTAPASDEVTEDAQADAATLADDLWEIFDQEDTEDDEGPPAKNQALERVLRYRETVRRNHRGRRNGHLTVLGAELEPLCANCGENWEHHTETTGPDRCEGNFPDWYCDLQENQAAPLPANTNIAAQTPPLSESAGTFETNARTPLTTGFSAPQPSINPLQLPLTEAQREELAKVVRATGWPVASPFGYYTWELCGTEAQKQAFSVVDAIAPRIARMGAPLRELTADQIRDAWEGRLDLWTAQGTNERRVFDVTRFASAILAAAQGGVVERDAKPESTAERDAVSAAHRMWRKWLREVLELMGYGYSNDNMARGIVLHHFKQPPRGRKLTDGERQHLNSLALRWSRGDADCSFTAVTSFVESLLTPENEWSAWARTKLGVMGLSDAKLREGIDRCIANLAGANISESKQGRKLTSKEEGELISKALDWLGSGYDTVHPSRVALIAFVESLLAPQDEVRVALGVLELVDIFGWVRQEEPLFSKGGDKLVTQALSASTGDKWDFAVVARRVEK